MKKNQITYLVIFIAVFLIAIIGATYAFFEFGGVTIDGNLPLNTATGSSAIFTAYSDEDITLNVNKEVMHKDVVSTNAAASDTANIHIKLDGGMGSSATACTYDLIWVWDSEDQYKKSTVELPYSDQNYVYYNEFSISLGGAEKDLSNLEWNENRAVIVTKSISVGPGEIKNDDYEVIINFYNLPVKQNNLSGKTFQGHIEVSEARCTTSQTIASIAKKGDNLSFLIKSIYKEQGTNTGNGKLFLHDSTLENGANDGSYRFAGEDPNNYVCFEGDTCDDDHKYRIIGVFGDNVKLMKMTSVGNKVWNESENNIWEGSTMDTYLNGEWLNSFKYSSFIEEYEWNVGGIRQYYDTNNWNNVKDTYAEEMSSSSKVTRKVGLVYASDFGYAALSEKKYGLGDDWMLSWNEHSLGWTISRHMGSENSAYSNTAYVIYNYGLYDLFPYGFIDHINGNVKSMHSTKPCFYLKANVLYKGGFGTETDPIIVSIPASEKIKTQYTSQGVAVGNGVMYLHDSTLENGAGDGSYRYAGADPDNYLCFEGDTCDDDHKYRIIGIFGENLKVIKMTSVGNKVWNSSGANTWDGSTMDTYLNNEWLTSFGHSDLIEDYDWHVGGMADTDIKGSNYVKHTLDVEMASIPVVNRKIGLMYASDYGYAAENTYWAKDLLDYEPSKGHDWMLTNASKEWTISRYLSYSNGAFVVHSAGYVNLTSDGITGSYAARPSFYLRSSVEIKSGSGSSSDPWIMGL